MVFRRLRGKSVDVLRHRKNADEWACGITKDVRLKLPHVALVIQEPVIPPVLRVHHEVHVHLGHVGGDGHCVFAKLHQDVHDVILCFGSWKHSIIQTHTIKFSRTVEDNAMRS